MGGIVGCVLGVDVVGAGVNVGAGVVVGIALGGKKASDCFAPKQSEGKTKSNKSKEPTRLLSF